MKVNGTISHPSAHHRAVFEKSEQKNFFFEIIVYGIQYTPYP